jgi:ketol-acid reductoisomerase (EC 1.1.1.86)
VDDHVKQNMKQILSEIQKDKGAKFAKEWLEEAKKGYSNFNRLREEVKNILSKKLGKKLRAMMKFLKKK